MFFAKYSRGSFTKGAVSPLPGEMCCKTRSLPSVHKSFG